MSNDITYEWQFPALDVNYSVGELQKVVTTVHWVLNATAEDGYSGSVYGSIGVPEPTPEAFVSYEDLTQEEVQAWVEGEMGEEQLQTMKDNLAQQIETARAPVTGTLTPPWNTVVQPVPEPEPEPEPEVIEETTTTEFEFPTSETVIDTSGEQV